MEAAKSPFPRQYLTTFAKLKLESIIIIRLLPGPLFSRKDKKRDPGTKLGVFLVFVYKMLIYGAVKVSVSFSSSPQIMQLFESFTGHTASFLFNSTTF